MKLLLILTLLIFVQIIAPSMVTISAQDLAKIDSLLYRIEATKDDSAMVYLNVAISREYLNADVITSLNYGEKALTIAEKSNNKNLISYALFNLGICYFFQGVMEVSIKYFYKYLEIQQELNHEKMIAFALVNLGAVHVNLKQYDQAEEHLVRALEIFIKTGEDTITDQPTDKLISIYNNLGVVASEQNQPDLAIDYYKRGTIIARRATNQEVDLANLLNNLGNIYLKLGQFEEAFSYFSEAFEIRAANDDQLGLTASYLAIANYFEEQNESQKALNYLYKGYALAEKVGAISKLADFYDAIYQNYKEKNEADSALKYHILLAELNEKLNKEAALKELTHLEITARYKENEKLIQLEQKRKELRYLMIGLTLCLTIAILSLLYFLANSRNRRLTLEKENIRLTTKNLELEKTNLEGELDTRNKELATNVMYQIQKNELINDIVQKLQKHSTSDTKKYPSWVLEIVRDLEKTQDHTVWNEFEVRFQQVHNDFYKKLNEINPELSPNERRLCAFLRLNMTTKEISSITGQSYRSIEVARTRLRKKLNLTNSETGLIEFLSTL